MEVVSGDDCFRMLDLEQYILYYIGADWCAPCQEASPKFDELSKEYDNNKIKFLKVEMSNEENREFIAKSDIRNIPTFILFKNRNFQGRIVGPNFDGLKEMIDHHINLDDSVNRNIFNVQPQAPLEKPAPAPAPQEEKIEDFYPNDTFQGEFEGFIFKMGDKGMGYYLDKQPLQVSGDQKIEIHMVYGEWCGHSKRAKPAFEELVSKTDVTTSNGTPVTFVMTDDKSEAMAQFREKVRGFPTYMTVIKEGDNITSMEQLNGHDRSKDSIIDAVKVL